MNNKLAVIFVAALILLLSACSGGGGGGDAPAATKLLAKYAGTYYVCDGHSMEAVTATAVGADSLNLSYEEKIYQNANCAGGVVGTYSLPSPITFTYVSNTTATFPPVTVLPFSDTVDNGTITSPAMTAQLSGTGVSGSCVTYTGGNFCYNNLTNNALSETGAIYLKDNYLVTLSLKNGVLTADGIYSKDASFNINSLVLD